MVTRSATRTDGASSTDRLGTGVQARIVLRHEDFIMRNHHVHGTSVLPGVTFLDLVLRTIVARGVPLERCELRDVLFEEAITTVAGGDREVVIEIGAPGGPEGLRPISARSRWVRGATPAEQFRSNFRGQLALGDAAPISPIDLDGVRSGAQRISTTDELYARARTEDIRHGPAMTCRGALHHGPGYLLAELGLDPSVQEHDTRFLLHPAKLDASTLAAFAQVAPRDGDPFIPLYIASFRAMRPLTGTCLAWVPQPEFVAPSGDVMRNDYSLHDATGATLALFTGITCKRIRHPELLTRTAGPHLMAGSPVMAAKAVGQSLPDEGRRAGLDDVVAYLREVIGARLGRLPGEVAERTGFYDLGLDSIDLLDLGRELESYVGRSLYPTLLFEFTDIASLAAHLHQTWAPARPAAVIAAPAPVAAPAAIPATGADLAVRVHQPAWHDDPVPSAAGDASSGTVLVVGGGSGGDSALPELRRRLAATGRELVSVPRPDSGGDPIARAQATGSSLEQAFGAHPDADAVVVLAADPPCPPEDGVPAGYREASTIASAIVARRPARPVDLHVVHSGRAEDAALACFGRTVSAETPVLRCRTVEVDSVAGVATAVVAELTLPGPEPAVRRRGDGTRREVRRYEVTEIGPACAVPAALRPGGGYLITGGGGELAGLLTDRLVTELGAHVVLLGRSGPGPELIDRLAAWGRAGGDVRYVTGDVTDAAAVATACAAARAAAGRLDGVVHCAGALRDGVHFLKDPADAAAVVVPKVLGLRRLTDATRDDDLAVFVAFSSLSAACANVGQSDYAYANGVLEETVERGGVAARRAVAIGWPLWSEGGMRPAGTGAGAAVIAADGTAPLPTTAGLDALWHVLAGTAPRVTVSHGLPGTADLLARAETRTRVDPRPAVVGSTAAAGDAVAGSSPLERSSSPDAAGYPDEPIAVVGMAGYYPQSPDLEAFWRNLRDGRDCITEVPPERWDNAAIFDPEPGAPGRTYGRWGGFLDGVDRFDHGFFGISRREAARMDPQERLFLTTCWHAVEDAGYRPDALEGEVGVFVGVMWNHYQLLDEDGVHPAAMHSAVANRVSYTLGLTGPSMAVDTACSSSLTAVHLAVQSLRRGECDRALAGGVNVTVHPQKLLQLAQGRFLSTDGRCRSFGAGGDGYVPGEGVGAILLTPLSRARAAGDHVYALIRGSALNHTGRGSGFTVPNPVAQATVIRRALEASGIDPRTVGCLEAHGTGTALGDPIEVQGLITAFAGAMPRTCALGSVKAAIGHTESAAGIAGLTKVLLQMRYRTIAPSPHSATPNPHLELDGSGFTVPQQARPWLPTAGAVTLRAGVSAFGAGGSNAHVVLESAQPAADRKPLPVAPELVVLSARDEQALRAQVMALAGYLDRGAPQGRPGATVAMLRAQVATLLDVPEDAVDPDEQLGELGLDAIALGELAASAPAARGGTALAATTLTALATLGGRSPVELADLAYTLRVGRTPWRHRWAAVVSSVAELRAALAAFDPASAGTAASAAAAAPAPADPVELFRRGRLAEVARIWLEGAEVDWAGCDAGTSRRRVALPTYPLRGEPTWIGRRRGGAPAAAADAADAARADAAFAADAVASPDSTTAGEGADLAPAGVEQRLAATPDQVADLLRRVLGEQLHASVDELPDDRPLRDLGLESVGAMELVEAIRTAFAVDLPTVALFDHPTVELLAAEVIRLGATALAPQSSVAQRSAAGGADIAVIGMSGRFPDADDLDEFWANLVAGRDSFRDVPADRWDVHAVYDPDRRTPGRTYTTRAAMLRDVDRFDAAFFSLSPLEAEAMDPQQRLFLEQSWAALEQAGYATGPAVPRRCAVFAGCATGDYTLLLAQAGRADSAHAFLGTTSSLLPARIGYALNLSGPTVAVDTACSSSLVAVHLAAEAIRRGECEMALAGGIALMVTPQLHVRASKVGMLSPTGRCVPFDRAADGTVLGEGVGVVVLKRLSAAIADGDHVHGVIRASGVNGDGRTNGITAPSAKAQAELIADVHARAGVAPTDIGYVEAHGTATPLGDPIEMAALTEVFRRGTDRIGFCGIGSVKANIGHTTMAAGIAGLLAVLLALRHRELPPAPAFTVANPQLELDRSPFHVVTRRSQWAAPDGRGPRTATVSSFGFSGTNAHLVVSEAPTRAAATVGRVTPRAVVVSARSRPALRAQLRRLAGIAARYPLDDIAYTLAAARAGWPVRAALVVRDVDELRTGAAWAAEALEAAGDGAATSAPGRYLISVPQSISVSQSQPAPDPTDAAAAEADRIARSFVRGEIVDWAAAFAGASVRRVPLPTYPFARDRHWVQVPQDPAESPAGAAALPLEVPAASHPMLGIPHPAGPDGVVTVPVTVDPHHWVIAEHRVMGVPVLPGAATLELAVAVAGLLGVPAPLRITDVRWLRLLDGPAAGGMRLVCTPRGDGAWAFAVHTADRDDPAVTGALSRGPDADRARVSTEVIRERCRVRVDPARQYEQLTAGGIDYGPSFRVLSAIDVGPDDAIGTLVDTRAGQPRAVHPHLLDGAQQLVAALEAHDESTLVPFAVDAVDLLTTGAVPVRAHLSRTAAHCYRLTLLDAGDRPCVRYQGLRLRAGHNPVDEMVFLPRIVPADGPAPAAVPAGPTLVLHTADSADIAAVITDRARALGDEVVVATLADGGEVDPVVAAAVVREELAALYVVARTGTPPVTPEADRTTGTVFGLVRSMITSGRSSRPLRLRFVVGGTLPARDGERVRPHAAGLLGLARAIGSECPRWSVGCVDIGAGAPPDPDVLARAVLTAAGDDLVLVREGQRLHRRFEPVRRPTPAGIAPFRRGGTYLIAGGAGGIGFALSRLLARLAGARLAWLGRRPEDDRHRAQLAEIADLGGQARYLQADITDPVALRAALDAVHAEFGPVHGAVHAALDLRDSTIANMTDETFSSGLAPKVAGLVAFGQMLAAEPLDFAVVFSSAVSFVEAGGQANYAAASTFEDSFAWWLRSQGLPATVVNWGFWGSVGAVATDRMRAAFDRLGVGSVEPVEALAALRRLITDGVVQAMVMKADHGRLPGMGIRLLGGPESAAPTPTSPGTATNPTVHPSPAAAGSAGLSKAAVRQWLRAVFAEVLKWDAAVLDERATFDNFGVDSLVSLSLLDRLGRDVGELPATALFEHQTITELAEFLVAERPEKLAHLLVTPTPSSALPARTEPDTGSPSAPADIVVLQRSRDGYAALEGLAGQLLHRVADRAGWLEALRTAVSVIALADRLGVRPEHRRLLRAVLGVLARAGVLDVVDRGDTDPGTAVDGGPVVALRPDTGRPAPDLEAFTGRFPELAAPLRLLQTCLDSLPEVLDGRRGAMEVLFPRGSTDLVKAVYQGQPVSDHYNRLLAAGVVEAASRPGPDGGAPRVVEIGAGTGASSQFVLRAVADAGLDVRYSFTDISSAFLRIAERSLGDRFTGMDFRLLDIERDPGEQGIGPATVDVAFATHVLHATADIGQTLRHIASMLRPGGRLLVNEVTRPSDFLTLTFGLTGGWWRFTDTARRLPDAPLLAPGAWRAALHEAGLRLVRVDGLPGVEADELEQCLLVAEKDGPSSSGPALEVTTTRPDAALAAHPANPAQRPVDIAVIGMAGRYPGQPGLDGFWSTLTSGERAISEIPGQRWDWRAHFDPQRGRKHRSYNRWGGFLDGIEQFDAPLFGILGREAAAMDPAERLFLETCWELLESTGYLGDLSHERQTGVFVGLMYGGYGLLAASTEWPSGQFAGAHSAYWSVANRVSYTFDLHGPSFAVDSACSSSLNAVHQAVESLRRGECRAAIAGGVNVIVHPAHFAALCARTMLSSSDACRVFDAAADGFVPGEGVGAVLLKPLPAALADGDTVWAVVRGASSNAGGKTSGYTVPNPQAQAAVVVDAVRRAGVDPATIGYIEAHGTGTALGDPIELVGLRRAWRELGAKDGNCAVGAVKSVIGHLEGAAGIAGFTKTVLQLRHRSLVPVAGLETVNPRIDLGDGPFVLQRGTQPWPAPAPEPDGTPVPRRAGVSSFGAGGANTHLVLEEAPAVPDPAPDDGSERLVVLSARSQPALRNLASRVAAFVGGPDGPGIALRDLAFSSQVGRRELPQRLAVLACTHHELADALRRFAAGEPSPCATGSVESGADEVAAEATVARLVEDGQLRALAELWVRGASVDWRRCHRPGAARRVCFPTYPFERRRYWLHDDPTQLAPAPATVPAAVGPGDGTRPARPGRHTEPTVRELPADHPALALTAEHVVAGAACVPGVAWLEVARSLADLPLDGGLRIREVRWTARVGIAEIEAGATGTVRPDGDATAVAIGAGFRAVLERGAPALPAGPHPALLHDRCTRSLDVNELYSAFRRGGVVHGPGLRTVTSVVVGAGVCVAKVAGTDSHGLDVGLLDGALQSVAGLCPGPVGYVPVALGELVVSGPLPGELVVAVAEVTAPGRADGHRVFDLGLAGPAGELLAVLSGLEVAPLPGAPTETRRLRPVWRPTPLGTDRRIPRTAVVVGGTPQLRAELGAQLAAQGVRVVDVAGPGEDPGPEHPGKRGHPLHRVGDRDELRTMADELAEQGWAPEAVVHLDTGIPDAADASHWTIQGRSALDRGLHTALWLAATLLSRRDRAGLRWVSAYRAVPGPAGAVRPALAATLRTLSLEHTRFAGAAVEVPASGPDRTVAQAVVEELVAATPGLSDVRFRGGVRETRTLEPIPAGEPGGTDVEVPVRENGTYLISGGAGALGLHTAAFLADHGAGTVILLGRSACGPEIERRIARVRQRGARIVYRSLDLADRDATRDTVAALRSQYGPVRGIVHAAGVTRDCRAVVKTPQQVEAVLAPKVFGTVHLDEATVDDPLDFMVLYSSLSAEAGNPGQADYAFANAFLGAFAQDRERNRLAGTRRGRTVAICWPLWAEGGMTVDEATVQLFAQRWGMVPMSTRVGLATLAWALGGDRPELAVVEGPAQTQRAGSAAGDGGAGDAAARKPVPGLDTGSVLPVLAELAAGFLMVEVGDVDVQAELLELGFDSITMTELVSQVNERFGLDLLPTVLFECPDLAGFAQFLVDEHGPALAEALGATPAPVPPAVAAEPVTGSARGRPAGTDTAGRATDPVDVAVIGMAGTFPGSADLAEFWAHLVAGDDVVGPVPAQRTELADDPVVGRMRGGWLEAVDAFDARHFGIAPREAALMDPQQRLFLQTVWHAFEDAGIRPQDLAGTATGVFAGVATHDYDELLKQHGVPVEAHTATGIAHSVLANRISHLLDLHGTSEAVDTACSSSLVAIHRAVRAIREGECALAVAGGVNVILSPGLFAAFHESGMLSPDGRCKAFDRSADGYVRGEGVGAVVLKPLAAARADGDPVLAIVRGSAVNHSGRSTSLTAPNPQAQAKVIAAAHRRAGIDPDTVTYIEAHGTGTALGDPVEIEGLKKAFAQIYAERGREAPADAHIGLGTVKTNIGHLEAAAGIAGVLKVLLCMRHGELPAMLHLREMNPLIRLDGTPFAVRRERARWAGVTAADGQVLRRAGVSSFGFGGSNAHLVLEAATAPTSGFDQPTAGPEVVPISAPDEQTLAGYAGDLARHLEAHPDLALLPVAHTLRHGRGERVERLALVVHDRDGLVTGLRAAARGEVPPGAARGRARHVAHRAGRVAHTVEPTDADTAARTWADGGPVAWPAAPGTHRVSLPPVPFLRTRHWFAPPSTPPKDATVATPISPAPAAAPATRRSASPIPPVVTPRRGPRRSLTPLTAVVAEVPVSEVPVSEVPVSEVPVAEVPAVTVTKPATVPDGSAADPSATVAETVREKLAEILGLDPAEVADDVPFADLGLDSVYRMEIARAINDRFGLEVTAAEFYEYDTVARLTGFVLPRLPVPAGTAGTTAPATGTNTGVPVDEVRACLQALLWEVLGHPVDPEVAFDEAGVGSFEMLKVIVALEKRCGALPKTLLFDHPTVTALAAFLVTDRGGGVVARLKAAPTGPATAPSGPGPGTVVEKTRLGEHPEIAETVARLERDHGRESGLPGRDIAPLIFLESRRRGYLNVSHRDDVLFAWSYVGPTAEFPVVAREFVEHGRSIGAGANLVSLVRLDDVDGMAFTATPFGALQRLENLNEFTLAGSTMQRLRYLVNRFERGSRCRTEEYRVGTDPATDHRIAEIIDEWAGGKPMINPYVHTVRAEIARGALAERHRMFLTRIGDQVVSAVILTKIPSERGYLLDLEFYGRDLPLGGLEHACTRIIEQTRSEGCDVFSFGASFGVKLGDSPNSAPETETALEELRSRSIFTGTGNFQFKNKFRPTNYPLYLCQPADGPRTDVSAIILMIADPTMRDLGRHPAATTAPVPPPVAPVPVATQAAAHPAWTVAERERLLAEHGYNPLALPTESVPVDLLTDSWAELGGDFIDARRRELNDRRPGPRLRGLLPFNHLLLTPSGKAAQAALCRAWPRRGPLVVHNTIFPSWTFTLLDHGFEPVALPAPHPATASTGPMGCGLEGDLDLNDLRAAVEGCAENIAFVCIELAGNARGGAPVSLANLTAVRDLVHAAGVPLVLDATRVLDNAVAVTQRESGQAGRDVWEVADDLLRCADAVTVSATKNLGAGIGGIVATSDDQVAGLLRERVAQRGPELARAARHELAAALADRAWSAAAVTRRVGQVRDLRDALRAAGAPVVGTATAHCVLLDVAALPRLAGSERPVAAFLAELFRATGLRAAPHLADPRDPAAWSLVRIAIPVGLPAGVARDLTGSLVGFVSEPGPIPDLLDAGVADPETGAAVYHPLQAVPADITDVLRQRHRPSDENAVVLAEHQPAVTRQVLRWDGGDVEVFAAGAGPVLVAMVPFNIGAGVFAHQFAQLGSRYRVVAVHHPGVGATTVDADLTWDGIADLMRRALHAIGIGGPVHLLGASFGGLTAQAFAVRYPEWTASLTLIGSSYKLGNRGDQANRLSVVAAEDFDRIVAGDPTGRLAAQRPGLERQLLRCESMDPRIGLRFLDVFETQPNLLERLPRIGVPTLIVQGSLDTVIPVKTAHLLHGLIPDSTFHQIDGAGHFPTLTHPEELHRVLEEFLATHPVAPITMGA